MKNPTIYRLLVLTVLLFAGRIESRAQAEDWMFYDMTPVNGGVTNIDAFGGLLGIQVRLVSGSGFPDSITIEQHDTQYPGFPLMGTFNSTGSGPDEPHDMGGRIKAYWFVADIGPNETTRTSGTVSATLRAYKNGVASSRPISFSQTVLQQTTRIEPGAIGSNQTINTNTAPAKLQGTEARSYNGVPSTGISYTWYMDEGSGWKMITGATQSSLQPGMLSRTTRYKRSASDGVARSESNIVEVTVRAPQEVQPDAGRNYVIRYVPRTGSPAFEQGDAVANRTTITYHDDLGRPQQLIEVNGSPSGKDLVQPIVYDPFGRSDAISYLPYEATGPAGSYKTDWLGQLNQFYGTLVSGSSTAVTNPQIDTRYEVSALDRIASQQGPGSEFRNNGRAKTFGYDTNTTAELLWFAKNPGCLFKGNYPANKLFKTRIENEDGNVIEEFKDHTGNLLLHRTHLTPTTYADTYYVYDQKDRLVYVLPPLAVEKLNVSPGNPVPDDFIRKYMYAYTYDGRDNIASKQLPGCTPESYTYNRANLPTIKSHSYADGTENTIYEYDGLNRIVREVHAAAKPNPSPGGPAAIDVQNNMAVYRYDTYPQLSWAAFKPVANVASGYDARVKGLKTYEKIWMLDFSRDEVWAQDGTAAPAIERVFYYDAKGRLIQTVERTRTGDVRHYTASYDWLGDVIATDEVHTNVATPNQPIAVRNEHSYDLRSRLIQTITQVDGRPYAMTGIGYDPLGRLSTKTFDAGIGGLTQTTTRNIRGWITSVSSDKFSLDLAYTNPTYASPNYAGTISEISWRHKDLPRHTYGFSYDGLERLSNTSHYIDGVPTTNFTEQGLTYDKSGNLLSLVRNAEMPAADRLTYGYDGNRLTSIAERRTQPNGQLITAEHAYSYDILGNMTKDGRNNLDLKYNLLNLIQEVRGSSGMPHTTYTYDWQGQKLGVRDATGVNGLDYSGSLVYKVSDSGRSVESIAFDGGRLTATSEGFEPHYYLTDHLGSVRTVIGHDGEILEQNDYYPLGMRWQTGLLSDNRYRYNGKEDQAFAGVPYLDYGARMYDPETGRWFGIDPLAEKYYPASPYSYCGNNPVNRIDPTGMIWEDVKEAERLKNNIDKKITSIKNDIAKNQTKLNKGGLTEKKTTSIKNQISEAQTRISNLNTSKADIDGLGADQNNVYDFSSISGTTHKVRQGSDGKVYIETSSDALSIHEITHVRQSLDAGGLKFSSNGELLNSGQGPRSISQMEVEAYRMQYSFDLAFPGTTRNLQGIDIHSVGAITDNGQLVYPVINQYSHDLKQYLKQQKKILGTP